MTEPAKTSALKAFYHRFSDGFVAFFTEPVSLYPLSVLRIMVALVLFAQAFAIFPFLYEFYGEKAIIQNSLNEFFNFNYPFPRINQIADFLTQYGIAFNTVVQGFFLGYLVALTCLLLGWQTRIAAIATWLLHFIIMNSSILSNYGIDAYAHFVLFYFTWMPIDRGLSLDAYFSTQPERYQWTPFVTISLRIFQLHMAFTYFVAGFGKAMGYMWWNGEAIWQSLMLPEYRQFDLGFFAAYPLIPMILGYATLIIETFYPVGMWIKRLRPYWVLAIVGLHFGIIVFQGLQLFGSIMMALTFCLFGLDYDYSEFWLFKKVKAKLEKLSVARQESKV